jgi:hypothetical protein
MFSMVSLQEPGEREQRSREEILPENRKEDLSLFSTFFFG